ncbi:saccharopine dehydrogenase C-terminal domain-containing protein [Niabella aurantiaca]|uniref:saccharopine dehydrogenase C-terminal domain-containing protein n=1 Tax=Niabella aurantiaca TaxID=379900 RepID=UPI00035CA645|nr:saccharopine dehydrogenase C-terminal domain-containing protein [Niabella aurantiaca]
MKKILLFGAGKSATVLIGYLLRHARTENWTLTIADIDREPAQSKLNGHEQGKAVVVDLNDPQARKQLVEDADIVISMLPPSFHVRIAEDCVKCKKHFLNASYIDDGLRQLKSLIEKDNLLFLCETGLDPGIDHMSAMQLFDKIRSKGGTISSFRSHCGGLIAPEDDNNPWHYKISWNPRNIALAGYAGAVYKEHNVITERSYPEVFENCPVLEIPPLGKWACYPNRNSLAYIPVYQLENTATIIRNTLRHPDFCTAWYYIVIAGLSTPTDDLMLTNFQGKSIKDWFTACLNVHTKSETFDDFLERCVAAPRQELVRHLFHYLGFFSDERIPNHVRSSADILQYLLETRLPLAAGDRDMIIMIHEIGYEIQGQQRKTVSSLMVKGDDALHTAMAKTVGLPLGIAARLILNGRITTTGLQIPVIKELYIPILAELEQNGIRFTEDDHPMPAGF